MQTAVKQRAAVAGVGGIRRRGQGKRDRESGLVFLWTEPEGSQAPPHVHVAVLDDVGDGLTTEAEDGHIHRIRGLEIEPAEDGHTHQLGAERAPEPPYKDYWRLCALLAPRARRERKEDT